MKGWLPIQNSVFWRVFSQRTYQIPNEMTTYIVFEMKFFSPKCKNSFTGTSGRGLNEICLNLNITSVYYKIASAAAVDRFQLIYCISESVFCRIVLTYICEHG